LWKRTPKGKKTPGCRDSIEALSCVKCEEQKQLISTGFEEELSGEKIPVSVGLWCL
jgi:hypothetical protein